jgi:hypothetical protein
MPRMSRIDLELPDELSSYVQQEVALRGYKDANAFVQALLEAERHRNLRAEIETMLLEAADGPFTGWTDCDVDDIRETGKELIERRKRR